MGFGVFSAAFVRLPTPPFLIVPLSMDLPRTHTVQPMPRPAELNPLDAALHRAFDAVRDIEVDYAIDPWHFYRIEPEKAHAIAWLNARIIEDDAGIEAAQAAYDQWRSVPGWVVVACLRVEDAEQQAHLKERCLTAVQRISLSLWSESIRTSWITELIVEDQRFYDVLGIDPVKEVAVGILWYGHAEKPHE